MDDNIFSDILNDCEIDENIEIDDSNEKNDIIEIDNIMSHMEKYQININRFNQYLLIYEYKFLINSKENYIDSDEYENNKFNIMHRYILYIKKCLRVKTSLRETLSSNK